MILRDKAALAAVLMMAILFGASFTGTKIALATFTPFELIFLRFAISSLCFLLIRPWRRHGRLPASDYGKLFLLAFFEPGIYFFCEAEGVKRTLASTASILIATIPLFVLVLEALYLKVRMIWSEVLMILISMGGIFLIVTAGGFRQAFGGTLEGNLFVLAAAFAASIYTVLAKRLLQRIDAIAVTFYQSIFAALLYLPFAGFEFATISLPHVPLRALYAVLYLGILCSFAAYLLLNFSLSRMKASIVSAFANIIPLVGVAVAFLVLGEKLYMLQIVGGLVVLACMTFLTMRPSPEFSGQALEEFVKREG
jgi:drug/metabolite transporter (DMT)-like permease